MPTSITDNLFNKRQKIIMMQKLRLNSGKNWTQIYQNSLQTKDKSTRQMKRKY
jgi:hypothetical protein